MLEQLHPETLKAKSAKWLGSLPCCAALGSADIGTAQLEDGSRVYITWGRNLDRKEQSKKIESPFRPIWIGADNGAAELLLPDQFVKPLLSVLK